VPVGPGVEGKDEQVEAPLAKEEQSDSKGNGDIFGIRSGKKARGALTIRKKREGTTESQGSKGKMRRGACGKSPEPEGSPKIRNYCWRGLGCTIGRAK